jgi:hypothetical protein
MNFNLKDTKTGKPFFKAAAWNLYWTILKPIITGCLSDIPQIPSNRLKLRKTRRAYLFSNVFTG